MDQVNLTLNLTVAQVNVILKHLGAGAFIEVEPIIATIREQAMPQLQNVRQPSDSGTTPDEE